MSGEEIVVGEAELAICGGGDPVHAAMAELAVATAMELGRWQPTWDFDVSDGALALTSTGRAQCEDGECLNTRGILDLQRAGRGEVRFAGMPFNGDAFRRRLVRQYAEQKRCEARPRRAPECAAELHALTFNSTHDEDCAKIFTFDATTPDGGRLVNTFDLANKLVFVGYPENPYLAFASTEATVSVDPTYGLNEDDGTSGGACSAACWRVSSTNLAGQCCSCDGRSGSYVRSTFSSSVYVCK